MLHFFVSLITLYLNVGYQSHVYIHDMGNVNSDANTDPTIKKTKYTQQLHLTRDDNKVLLKITFFQHLVFS